MVIYEEPKYYRVTLEYRSGKLYERILKFNRVSQKKQFKRRLRKSKYLVSYNFERVYGEYDEEMNKVRKEILSNAKHIPFNQYYIYALIKDQEIVYIGQSSNVMSRLGSHIQEKRKDFDSYAIVCKVSQNEVDEVERKYIDDLKPKYNIVHNKHDSSYVRQKPARNDRDNSKRPDYVKKGKVRQAFRN
jgi:hypothetical protein